MDYFLTFERVSGECLNTTTNDDDIPRDPALYVKVILPRSINYREERWDGATGVRPATAAEIATWDAKQPWNVHRNQLAAIRARLATATSPVGTLQDLKDALALLGPLLS